MGRPRKTERVDEIETAASDRDEPRSNFDNEMFIDEVTSPFHVPRDEWGNGNIMRWISVEVTGAPDNRNWSLKTAAHWVPVQRGKYPNIDKRFPATPMPGYEERMGGSIIFGGLCLCERDIRYTERDKKMQEKATQEAGRTIETYVEGGNANFPRFNQSQAVQIERAGRPVQFKE